MSFMFSICKSLSSLPDISKWDTKNVNDKRGMFFHCKENLNILLNLNIISESFK